MNDILKRIANVGVVPVIKLDSPDQALHKNIEKFKEMAKNSVSKDKVKNKQKEQSL